MTEQTDQNLFFYSTGEERLGPFTPQQLKALADNGTLPRTATVWKLGVEQGGDFRLPVL
jgi:hypothetical protein